MVNLGCNYFGFEKVDRWARGPENVECLAMVTGQSGPGGLIVLRLNVVSSALKPSQGGHGGAYEDNFLEIRNVWVAWLVGVGVG